MYRRFNGTIAALTLLPLMALAGCTQATRHSNVMIFGTNTSLGLNVGTDTTQVPSIVVGYKRQEAVILPLVANTDSETITTTSGTPSTNAKSGTSTTVTRKENLLKPCDVTKAVTLPSANGGVTTVPMDPHPCLLVAIDKDGKARDSYSVLASFGADFGASSKTGEANAQGGLAQYFATGMAAQLLALNGGAAVVATGEAAKKSVEEGKVTLDGIKLTDAEKTDAVKTAESYDLAMSQLVAKVKALPMDKLSQNIQDFEKAIGSVDHHETSSSCKKSPQDCGDYLSSKIAYRQFYLIDDQKEAFNKAVTAFPTVK